MESQILIVAVAGPHRPCRAGGGEGGNGGRDGGGGERRARRRGGGGTRNENGRIEFPICDMRPRAARAVMRARRADANGGEGEGRGPDCAMVTRRGDGHGGRESAGRGLGYHFSAVLPRKHVPGINELTISEQLFPHRDERSDRPTALRPFSTDLWWVRPKRSDIRESKTRGTSGENEATFAVARGENTRDVRAGIFRRFPRPRESTYVSISAFSASFSDSDRPRSILQRHIRQSSRERYATGGNSAIFIAR